MKKFIAFILSMTMLFSMSACSGGTSSSTSSAPDTQSGPELESSTAPDSSEETSQQSSENLEPSADGGNILIAYFSKTGNTETVANMIANVTGGELFKVETVTPYPDDYDETVDIAREEQDNDARPELSTHVEDMSQYDVIYLGYPNWWGTMPQAMFTFLEEYDFSGKTIIPFCTHGGSALGRSESDIAELVPDAELLKGLAVSGSRADSAEADVQAWIEGLNLSEKEE